MKIRGRHLHTQCQPPNLQTSCPLWTWKALFPAHQEVDLLADGQCECASHCEQSHGEFQHVPGCQASSPSNGSTNPATGRRLSSWHCRRTLCFFLRFRNIPVFLESCIHEETDTTFSANCPFFGSQMNRFCFSLLQLLSLLGPGRVQLLLQELCWGFPYRNSPVLPLLPFALIAAVADMFRLLSVVYIPACVVGLLMTCFKYYPIAVMVH